MSRRIAAAVAALAVLAGCGSTPTPNPSAKPTAVVPSASPTEGKENESGPESPIAYGFQVPKGASQVGPLVRYRSKRLLAAYKTEGEAAQARHDADKQRKRDEAEASGTPLPLPTPTPTSAPTDDTFQLLDNPPKPDITISLMRVNGAPTSVMHAMLDQIHAVLPQVKIVRNDLSKYCAALENRVTGCYLKVAGKTRTGRTLAVTLAVDPGDLATRTAPPASKHRPVMLLRVAYIGDPRAGQLNRRTDSDVSLPPASTRADKSKLIWPRMDVAAPASLPILNGWKPPLGSEVLLSSYHPSWAVVSTEKAGAASRIAGKFARGFEPEPNVDVVEDLNEITTTYRARNALGEKALAFYVLSARGYYAVLFYEPAG